MENELRKVPPKAERFSVSSRAVHKWKKELDWDNRCDTRDREIAEGVKDKLLPEWVDMKIYLIKTLIEQVRKAREIGVVPQSTRDIVAAVREIRGMMGEADKHEVELTGIEYVLKENKEAD